MDELTQPINGPLALLKELWRFGPGPLNSITDIAGVGVGHCQMLDPERGICTGVTALQPPGDLIRTPLPAAMHVINGYGKSTGLIQIAELGELESPILLTGVFGVGSVLSALTSRLLLTEREIGDLPGGRSVNTVVMECNDSFLHDPRAALPGADEVDVAFADVTHGAFSQGTVGAGVGMGTFGFAGGIGTASRVLVQPVPGRVGALVLSNFGTTAELSIAGRPVGYLLDEFEPTSLRPGSVIVVLATDLPMDSSQLQRLCRRAQNGLARTGCVTANGSGEIVVAFTITHPSGARLESHDLDPVFAAAAECVQESVLNAIWAAQTAFGRAGRCRAAIPWERMLELLHRADMFRAARTA